MKLVARPVPVRAAAMLEQAGVHPLLARLYAARGVRTAEELDTGFQALLPPDRLDGTREAATLLADTIAARRRILIVADYDCDGATACAVGLRALRALGAEVDFLVPNRFENGYGLSPEVVRLAAERKPHLIVTVDNGIASVEGVAEAKRLGIATLVTDHHLPGAELPAAEVIVNPNLPGCDFPSKAMAGVGVMFYVMLALRAELRRRGAFAVAPEPNLAELLDLVALGTVADVVPLDRNNRILVAQGLARIRAGRMQPGLRALFAVAGRDPARAGTFDLGFTVGPRINAAGRLADMSLGIEALVTDDPARALNIAQELDAINRERRAIEADMRETADLLLDDLDAERRASLVLFDPGWHQGVIGILAGRIKEKLHRPTFAFARGEGGEIKGSGRSIPGLHLRDALDLVAKRRPGLLRRFGGHAAAAGLTLAGRDLGEFEAEFEAVARTLMPAEALTRTLVTDGPLEAAFRGLETAKLLQDAVWGQAFPAPLFADVFEVESQRLIKDKHLKLALRQGGARFEAMRFHCAEPAASRIEAAYRLEINEWNGLQGVQLTIEDMRAAV